MIEKEKERIDDEGIDLLNLLLNLWNHKLLILVLACIAALFMFVNRYPICIDCYYYILDNRHNSHFVPVLVSGCYQ